MVTNQRWICPLLALLSGCVHYMPVAVSSTTIGNKYEKPVGTVTGIASAYYIFGFLGPIGDDSLNAAIFDATSYAPSDTLANVFVDRRLICFPFCELPLIKRIDTMIFGTLIKYSDEEGKPVRDPSVSNKIFGFDGTALTHPNPASRSTVEASRFLKVKPGTKMLVTLKDGKQEAKIFRGYNPEDGKVWFRGVNNNVMSATRVNESEIKDFEIQSGEDLKK